MSLAIAIESGSFKGVFGHGVLSALEAKGIKADAYACASSSVFSGGLAAIGKANEIGTSYWLNAVALAQQYGMSEVVLRSIANDGKIIKQEIFKSGMPRFLVAVSKVSSQEAQEITQGKEARKLGKQLLLDSMNQDNSWAQKYLEKIIFDSNSVNPELAITATDIDDILYASTRLLHAWEQPAWIRKQAYIDASYTCSCPAIELSEDRYDKIIVISPHPGATYTDLFRTKLIDEESLKPSQSFFIGPDYNLKTIGVDYTAATREGIVKAYRHGYTKGEELADKLKDYLRK